MSIDARSSVHPIHSTTDGLEGYVDLEWDPTARWTWPAKPAGQLSLPVSRLSSGNRMEDRELQKRIDARRYPTIDGVLGQMERSRQRRQLPRSAARSPSGEWPAPHEDEMTIHAVDDRHHRPGRHVPLRHPGVRHGAASDPDVEGRARGRRRGRHRRRQGGLTSHARARPVHLDRRRHRARAGDRPVAARAGPGGPLHHVHPEAFDQSFAMAAMGTVAEDAAAELVLLPVRARARPAAPVWECDDIPLACPLRVRGRSNWSAGTNWCSSRSSTEVRKGAQRVSWHSGPAGGVRGHQRPPGPRRRVRGDPDHQHRAARRRAPAARRLGAHPRRLRHVEDRRGGGQPGPGLAAADGPGLWGRARSVLVVPDHQRNTQEVEMGVIIGVVVGYAPGTRAGEKDGPSSRRRRR